MDTSQATSSNSRWNPFLRSCLQMQQKNFFAVIVFSFLINLLMLTVPLYLLQIFNRVIPSKSIDTLLFLTGIVVVAAMTLSILEAVRRYIFVRVGTWLDTRLGGFVLSGSINRSVNKCRKTSAQGLRDLTAVRRIFSGSTLFPILDAPWTPIFLLVLFMLHPLIGAIALAAALCLFILALINELGTRDLINEANEASSEAENYATAILCNSDTIEAMGMRQNVIGAWERRHSVALDLQTQASIRSNRIASIAKFLRTILQVVVIGVAAVLLLNNQLSAGGLIASLLLTRRAVAPMDKAISSWKVIVSARNSFNHVSERMDQAAELNASNTLPRPAGYLSISHASFKYPHASEPTLFDVTFKVKPGVIIGLSGNTAAGKSTLARLLVGIAEPEVGYVRFGGIDISRWNSLELGPYIGYLPQSSELFAGSVRQNIARMGDDDFDEVVSAARMAGVDEMINQFPQGYDTEIGEGGAYLSGGQRQRLALARAVYGNPKLVVLDEPDANLDGNGKIALARTIAQLKQKKAMVVLISHQSAILDRADTVLTLGNGKITHRSDEQGSTVAKKLSRTSDSQIVNINP
jgi:ATP-binding cassette, subfamily C, type I secretion system permease/ATPase